MCCNVEKLVEPYINDVLSKLLTRLKRCVHVDRDMLQPISKSGSCFQMIFFFLSHGEALTYARVNIDELTRESMTPFPPLLHLLTREGSSHVFVCSEAFIRVDQACPYYKLFLDFCHFCIKRLMAILQCRRDIYVN